MGSCAYQSLKQTTFAEPAKEIKTRIRKQKLYKIMHSVSPGPTPVVNNDLRLDDLEYNNKLHTKGFKFLSKNINIADLTISNTKD